MDLWSSVYDPPFDLKNIDFADQQTLAYLWGMGDTIYPPPPAFLPSSTDDDPVDISSGEELQSPDPDLSFRGASGLTATFQRTYSTIRAKNIANSPGLTVGWTHNYDSIIRAPLVGYSWNPLNFYAASGGVQQLTPLLDTSGNPTGAFTVSTGIPYQVTGVPSTTMVGDWQSIKITYQSGMVESYTNFYAGSLVLTSITDNLGRSLALNWSSTRLLQNVADASTGSALLTLTYNSDNLLARVTDFSGREVDYSYSPPGGDIRYSCLTGVSQISVGPTSLLNYSYAYTAGNMGVPLLTAITQPSPSGQAAQPGQPSINGMATSTISFTYDPTTWKIASQTRPNGTTHTYTYNTGNTQINVTDVNNNTLPTYTDYYRYFGPESGYH